MPRTNSFRFSQKILLQKIRRPKPRNGEKYRALLIFWLAAAIIPAATARETPHALRIENGLPVFMIFLAAGLNDFYRQQIAKRKGKLIIGSAVFLYILNSLFYFHNYYVHYPWEYSGEWQFGYREAINFIKPVQKKYREIVMTDSIGRPYMYTLFYEKTDPEFLWRNVDASFDAAGFYNVYGLGQFRFQRGAVLRYAKKTLYILDPQNVPGGAHILQTINLLNGKPILVIFDMP